MRKARMRIYDQRHQEWLELVAQRTAKEVISVMEADFLEHKSPIKMLDIVVKNDFEAITLPLFVDSLKFERLAKLYETTTSEYESSIIEQLKEMLGEISREKGFNQEAKRYLLDNDYFKQFVHEMLPPDFGVIVEVEGVEKYYPSSYNIQMDLTNEADIPIAKNDFKVSYVFNDHGIEKYSYKSEARQKGKHTEEI